MSVINDLVTDHRVQKTCLVLQESGYRVELIGRELEHSLPLPSFPFKTSRMRMLFKRGPLFYLFYNFRLFFLLLFKKADLLFSNDLDTLGANYLISRIKGTALIYDSHELFCEVPELLHRPLKRRIWQYLEAYIVPKLKYCITVNDSIAEIYTKKYGVRFQSIRNIPDAAEETIVKTRADLGLPIDKKIVLLQGAGINMDRGAEELFEAMKELDNTLLLLIGSGDNWVKLKDLLIKNKLENKIRMIDKLPRTELLQYTRLADLGISIDKANNLNYLYSLPNKVFDYIQSGVPVLCSRLPEIEKIISGHGVGEFIESHESKHLAERIQQMLLSPKLPVYKSNTLLARKELNWQKEKQKLKHILDGVKDGQTLR